MIASTRDLAAVAYALLGREPFVTAKERRLVPATPPMPALVKETRAAIKAGRDPLGDAFLRLYSAEERRGAGATYTPKAIIDAMIGWAAAEAVSPARVVDPGAGSGRFTIAAAVAFPNAQLVAVEIDPLAALMLRANAAVLGFQNRLKIELKDYRKLKLAPIDGPTLFIGNPPYVRHHNISPQWKEWLATTARRLGFAASGLSGLHIHFFLQTRAIARDGDYGAFITASEWLDVNYGALLRNLLADGLGGTALHVVDPKAQPFPDAMTTGAITCFRVGRRPADLIMRAVDSLDELAPLSQGRAVGWTDLEPAKKWSILIRPGALPVAGAIELGELFRVHRGQVSGANAVWIETAAAPKLPARFLYPTVTKARDLIDAGQILSDPSRLRRVVDLPADLDELKAGERKAVEAFLTWAKHNGGDQGWIATHRRAWWSVGLRAPAPILCTYMARRAPAFVRNDAKARHLNIAHGLYPREHLSDQLVDAILEHLRGGVALERGRTYAGGLVKFEPGEVERLHIPDPHSLLAEVSS